MGSDTDIAQHVPSQGAGTSPTTARSARDVLTWSHATIQPALRAAVDTLSPPLRRIAAYHLGWSDEHDRPTQAGSGKAIRPALTLLAAQAVGGTTAAAVPAATAVELVHNFSLLHDDVMDRDTSRRHRPTAWTVFGASEAILAGDALLALALGTLADSGHPAAADHTRLISTAVLDLTTGQGADLAFEERGTVALGEYLDMATGKTAALISCACTLGALSADAAADRVEHLRSFGAHLGTAFQFVDDLLGIWGDPTVTGKPTHSDLHSRKKTLPVITALNSGTPAASDLAALYQGEQALTDTDAHHAARLIDTGGGRDGCQAHIEQQLSRALHHLQQAEPAAVPADELRHLAQLITDRDH